MTDITLYSVCVKLWNKKTAIFTILAYIILHVFYEGNGLWFDLALTPLVLLVFYFVKRNKIMRAGLFWSLALITKQTGIWFVVPILIYFFKGKKLNSETLKIFYKFLSAVLIVLTILILILFVFKIVPDFYFWTVRFGVFYLPNAAGQIQLPTIKQFLLYLFPFISVFFTPAFLPWVFAGLMGAYPRFGLFHFQPALPFLAMSIGISLTKSKMLRNIPYMFYIFLTLMIAGRYILRGFGNETRFYEAEVKKTVSEMENVSDPDDQVYVLNYWDNIYALTGTVPATRPWFPYLPWYLSLNGVRQEILGDLYKNMPESLVVSVEPEYDWVEFDQFLKFYTCREINGKLELCQKNAN